MEAVVACLHGGHLPVMVEEAFLVVAFQSEVEREAGPYLGAFLLKASLEVVAELAGLMTEEVEGHRQTTDEDDLPATAGFGLPTIVLQPIHAFPPLNPF